MIPQKKFREVMKKIDFYENLVHKFVRFQLFCVLIMVILMCLIPIFNKYFWITILPAQMILLFLQSIAFFKVRKYSYKEVQLLEFLQVQLEKKR